MGSPGFALPSLRALAAAHQVVGVVTQPDRASGRGRVLKAPPVKLLAQELDLPVIQPEKLRLPEALEQLHTWGPDLIVVAAFGQILRKDVLALPRAGCINVHASLLPRWRGAAPINAALLDGDEETGVTIMKMDVGLDTGPMLSQRSIRLTREDTAGSVTETLSHLGADLLSETLPKYLSGQLQPVPQPEEGVTQAPMLKKRQVDSTLREKCMNSSDVCAPSIHGPARSWILMGPCSKFIARMWKRERHQWGRGWFIRIGLRSARAADFSFSMKYSPREKSP